MFEVGAGASDVLFSRVNLGLFDLDIRNVESLEVNGNGGNDIFTVNDLSATALQNVTFNGGDGDDVLNGTAATHSITALGGNGADALNGGAEVDTLHGGDGDDTIVGFLGNDRKDGGAGDDLLIWNNGDGSDRMIGGTGDDTVQVNGADGLGDEFVVGAGASDVQFSRVNLGLFDLDISEVETLEVNGQDGNDSFTVNDLTGTGLQSVVFNGADGNDVLNGAGATRSITADGGDGNDFIGGGVEIDNLRGGDGDDTIIGFTGDDTKDGGAGDDMLVWNNGDGSDRMIGGTGDDLVQVNGADGAGDIFEVGAGASDVLFSRVNLGLFDLDISEVEILEVNGQDGDDMFTVGDLAGTGLQNVVFNGGGGNDTLDASTATRAVEANGGDGDDALISGAEDDTFTGGAGSDQFVYNAIDDGVDTITDFELGTDQFVLDGFIAGFDPALSDPNDFFNLVDNGTDSTVQVDIDGAGAGAGFQDLAILTGITGVDVDTLASDIFVV